AAPRRQVTDIARRHEALMEILGLAGGIPVELCGVADIDAADLTAGHFVEITVQDSYFSAPSGLARSVGRGTEVLRGRRGDHAGLCGVVVVVDDVTELIHELGDDIGTHP